MSADIDVASETAETDSVQPQMSEHPSQDTLSDDLADPLGEAGDESVQMVLPPKPGVGPRTTDTFEPLDQLVAALSVDPGADGTA